MDTYLVRLKPLSPYLTPWRSCTLWGRLCWIIADGRLPGWKIEDWLECYKIGEPPLIIGDAFPSNAVPVPAIYHALPKEKIEQLLPEGVEAPPKTLTWEEWRDLCATGKFLKPKENTDAMPSKNGKVQRTERIHVVMDRASGRAAYGGLRTEIGWQPDELIFVARVDSALGLRGLETLVRELCLEGWGQGRTYGYGHVEFLSVEDAERPESTRWAATLGHCHLTDDLPTDGYWRWAGVPVRPHDLGRRQGKEQFFTTMLLPGATFATDKTGIGHAISWDGRKDYLHYGLAPTWPVSPVRESQA